jgi:hypothetical protein
LVRRVFGRLYCDVAGSGGGEIVSYEAGKKMLQRLEEREQQQHGAGVRRIIAGPSPSLTPSFGVRMDRMDDGGDISESNSEGAVVEEAESEDENEDESKDEIERDLKAAVYISAVKPARIDKRKPAAEKRTAEDLRRKIKQQDLLPKPRVTRRNADPPVIVQTMDLDMGSTPASAPTKHEKQGSRDMPGKQTAPRRTLPNDIADVAPEQDIFHCVSTEKSVD